MQIKTHLQAGSCFEEVYEREKQRYLDRYCDFSCDWWDGWCWAKKGGCPVEAEAVAFVEASKQCPVY